MSGDDKRERSNVVVEGLTRREFSRDLARGIGGGVGLLALSSLAACGVDSSLENSARVSGAGGLDVHADEFVTLYDTYAMATYFDGSLGPRTGIVTVDMIIAGVDVDMDFWHGHGGNQHRFRVTTADLRKMNCLQKVFIETTVVDSHTHKLFVDFSDPRWRVANAQPVRVPKIVCES